MKKIAIILAAMALPGVAHATAFTNGDFEAGPIPGSFVTLGAGSTAVSGWTVGDAGIDYIGDYWQPGDGTRSIDLSALGAGSLSQSFDTVIGQTYKVDFLMAANQDGGDAVRSLSVNATGGSAQSFNFTAAGHSKADMGWLAQSYSFKATSAVSTLSFTSLNNNPYGPALDAVSISTAAVPEPASWAMMIGGFALAGGAMRRKRGQASLAIA